MEQFLDRGNNFCESGCYQSSGMEDSRDAKNGDGKRFVPRRLFRLAGRWAAVATQAAAPPAPERANRRGQALRHGVNFPIQNAVDATWRRASQGST
jgi:hypothetical protein